MSVTNANLAAWIAATNGAAWLETATPRQMSAATEVALRVLSCGPMDTRGAVSCLKAIQSYNSHVANRKAKGLPT